MPTNNEEVLAKENMKIDPFILFDGWIAIYFEKHLSFGIIHIGV